MKLLLVAIGAFIIAFSLGDTVSADIYTSPLVSPVGCYEPECYRQDDDNGNYYDFIFLDNSDQADGIENSDWMASWSAQMGGLAWNSGSNSIMMPRNDKQPMGDIQMILSIYLKLLFRILLIK